MPAGDVWGNSWGDSWNSFWVQAVEAPAVEPRQPGGGYYARPVILVDKHGRPISRDKLANKAIQQAKNAIDDLPVSERPEARETLSDLRSAVRSGHVEAIAEQSRQLAVLLEEFQSVMSALRDLEAAAIREADEDEEEAISLLLLAH
jgi:hypothetical protein